MKIINFFKFILSSAYRKEIKEKELTFVQNQIISISSEIEESKDIARRIHENAIDKNSSYETQRHAGRNEDLRHNYQLLDEYQRREKYLKEKLEEAPLMNEATKKTILLSLCSASFIWINMSLMFIFIFLKIPPGIDVIILYISILSFIVVLDSIYKKYPVDESPLWIILGTILGIVPFFIAMFFFGKYL